MDSVACVRTTRLRSTIELHGSLFISPSLFLLLYSPDSWLNSSKAHRFDFTPSVCVLSMLLFNIKGPLHYRLCIYIQLLYLNHPHP